MQARLCCQCVQFFFVRRHVLLLQMCWTYSVQSKVLVGSAQIVSIIEQRLHSDAQTQCRARNALERNQRVHHYVCLLLLPYVCLCLPRICSHSFDFIFTCTHTVKYVPVLMIRVRLVQCRSRLQPVWSQSSKKGRMLTGER